VSAGLRELRVIPAPLDRHRGTLLAAGLRAPCALGRSGITKAKREGDSATPAGRHRLVAVFYRPDRVRRPATRLQVTAISPHSGWCDDPGDRNYNRFVHLPYLASHERLWREDRLYDLVVVLGYNLARPVPGRGSAIFLHLAAPGFTPTAGCVAVSLETMRRLLTFAGPETTLVIP
jgi:L,D-peptidoglycan transpeptidase YkuD (ErfK/YbiS/YcfS/YnhG family)